MKVFLFLLAILPFTAIAKDSPPSELVNSANRFSSQLSGGYEVETNRKYLKVDLAQSGLTKRGNAYLVFFTMEGHAGTNKAFHHWASLFTEKNPSDDSNIYSDEHYLVDQLTLIGNSGWRSVEYEKAALQEGGLSVPYRFWKKGDDLCCPSGTGRGRITFSRNKIVFLE